MAAPELDRRCVQALPEAREQRLAIAATHLDSCPEAIDPSRGGATRRVLISWTASQTEPRGKGPEPRGEGEVSRNREPGGSR